MKNFKSIQLKSGRWSIKVGRSYGGSFHYLADQQFDTEEEAQLTADYRNALELVKEARAIAKRVSLQQAKDIAFDAYGISDDVVRRAEIEDPDHSENDPKGWLA